MNVRMIAPGQTVWDALEQVTGSSPAHYRVRLYRPGGHHGKLLWLGDILRLWRPGRVLNETACFVLHPQATLRDYFRRYSWDLLQLQLLDPWQELGELQGRVQCSTAGSRRSCRPTPLRIQPCSRLRAHLCRLGAC